MAPIRVAPGGLAAEARRVVLDLDPQRSGQQGKPTTTELQYSDPAFLVAVVLIVVVIVVVDVVDVVDVADVAVVVVALGVSHDARGRG